MCKIIPGCARLQLALTACGTKAQSSHGLARSHRTRESLSMHGTLQNSAALIIHAAHAAMWASGGCSQAAAAWAVGSQLSLCYGSEQFHSILQHSPAAPCLHQPVLLLQARLASVPAENGNWQLSAVLRKLMAFSGSQGVCQSLQLLSKTQPVQLEFKFHVLS